PARQHDKSTSAPNGRPDLAGFRRYKARVTASRWRDFPCVGPLPRRPTEPSRNAVRKPLSDVHGRARLPQVTDGVALVLEARYVDAVPNLRITRRNAPGRA